jgi:hypothetical protein
VPPPLDPPIPYPAQTVRDALAPLRNDFSIALWAPGNAFAVGAVVRVAHSYLAKEIFVVGVGGWYPKASMGMHKYENVVRVADTEALLDTTAGRPSHPGSSSSSAASGPGYRPRWSGGPTTSSASPSTG